jgi:hypothetical protein
MIAAFSLENRCWRRWVKQLQSALELPYRRVVGAALPGTALAVGVEAIRVLVDVIAVSNLARRPTSECQGHCLSPSD